ncbi:hypothetical protein MMC07_002524 [Pseudocyphellaria aurata]|nr:hypothetical protein [Pseudocyphellaria aurata]
MALAFARAEPLKADIKLAQALSEFEAVLPDDQKTKLRTFRGQLPPGPADVMRFTAEIDRDNCRNRRSRHCVGPRLTNVLHAVQQFSTVVDPIVGSSGSQIAGAIWGTVKISLQLASAISAYFDQLSTLFMKIGLTCPRYQDFGLLYPDSKRLQSALCEYFVVFVRLCKQAILFLKKPFWSQLSSSVLKPFDSEFGGAQQELDSLACAIRDEVSLASNQIQQDEAKKMSKFRASFAKSFSDTSARDIAEIRLKTRQAELQFLNACSDYNHEKSWKQARKLGNAKWIFNDGKYNQWKEERNSSTLWCTGILGSGKTVLSANVVEDLNGTSAAVSYFFCRHDEAISLETRTIIGSIASQIFDIIKSDIAIASAISKFRLDTLDTDQILDCLQNLLPSNSRKYFVVIDGLDECEEKERHLLLQCLKQLLMIPKRVFQIYCSSRPDVSRWARTFLEPQWNISMPQTSVDIEEYVEDTLEDQLESATLSIGEPTLILTIKDALLENAHGMFLWVKFQIGSICSQKTDKAILAALEDLPKDLPDTFNRILRKLELSNSADPGFCKKIFGLMAAAQRPLTLEELREAVSVEPGETSWDTGSLINDMLQSLFVSCGSLLVVDEEHLTVHFAHHSVKQHFLSEPVIDSDMKKYHIKMREADLYLGDVIVTYLNFGIFDQQLVKSKSAIPIPQVKNYPSAILGRSLPGSKIISKVAVKLLRNRPNSTLDVHSQLRKAAGIVDRSEEQTDGLAYSFLSYAREYWLFHTKRYKPTRVTVYPLWRLLVDGTAKSVQLPWAPESNLDFGDKYINWVMQNEHFALINHSLIELSKKTFLDPEIFLDREQVRVRNAIRLLLELLEKKTTNSMNTQDIEFGAVLLLASFLNDKAVVFLSLKNGADINAANKERETALQVASSHGHEMIVRLLLENGADVNGVSPNGETTALHAALKYDHEEIAKLLLDNGADVNAVSAKGETALSVASIRHFEMIVRLLLKNGADVNAAGVHGETALHIASRRGFEKIVGLLLENGADVNAVSAKGETALSVASIRHFEMIVRLLLKNGADVNAAGVHGETALHIASRRGFEKIVGLLLENGADVNAINTDGETVLQAASQFNYETTVILLLNSGADVNASDKEGVTALHTASSGGHETIVRLLLDNGANVNGDSPNGETTALHAALKYDHEEIAKLLMDNGADVNAVSAKGETALSVASMRHFETIVRLLLKNGADVNAAGVHGETALHIASRRGFETIVGLLLENGADVNAINADGETVLQAASQFNYETTVILLLNSGADVNASDKEGVTALHTASSGGHETIVRLLLDNGADVNGVSANGDTALHAASRRGSESIMRPLLDNGADVKATDKSGNTALQVASLNGHDIIVRLLLDKGAIVDSRTLGLALSSGNENCEKLIHKALKAQSSTPSSGQTSSQKPA